MTEVENDTNTFNIALTGGEEPNKKETPWVLYLAAAGIALSLILNG